MFYITNPPPHILLLFHSFPRLSFFLSLSSVSLSPAGSPTAELTAPQGQANPA